MRIVRFLTIITLSLTSSLSVLSADENPRSSPETRQQKHFVFTPAHALSAEEIAELRADGVVFERNLTDGRYLVRAGADSSVIQDRNLGDMKPLAQSEKIYRGAYHQAATGKAVARFSVLFADDVAFDDAVKAIAAAGGEIESPLTTGFGSVKQLTVRMPSSSLQTLAGDDRVLAVSGPPLRRVSDNAVAAATSHVTPLYGAPYNLNGNGVVLSLFELGRPDENHVEFGGRLISHITSGTVESHATHVAGTMIASGIDTRAKGMSPTATLHLFNANVDPPVLLTNKQVTIPDLGSVADNNSWGFCSGWQPRTNCYPQGIVWFGGFEYIGGYDGFWNSPMDKIARSSKTLYVHSAGNEANTGQPDLVVSNFSAHLHVDQDYEPIPGEIFCYSKNGSGTDCPVPQCTAGTSSKTGEKHCEVTQHPTYGPFSTMGLLASAKNVIAVGALDVSQSGFIAGIASFSSRGPTKDGRVKPDIVAKGTNQISTLPGNSYGSNQGTSMSSPVIAGISGVLVEQWRKTFAGASPTPQQLKTLLLAGTDDLGNIGPDYTYGFGLANAQTSVDLVIADGATGGRIKNGSVSQGQTQQYTMKLTAAQANLRVVVGWADPEVFGLGEDDVAAKTLVNDLDLTVTDPSGATALPYVLNASAPSDAATKGVNTVDNVEEVEIKNAVAGTYTINVKGTKIGDPSKTTQDFVMIANAPLAAPCVDTFEPNDTAASAFGDIASATVYTSKLCSQNDSDFYKFLLNKAGTVAVQLTNTGDTAILLTEMTSGGAVSKSTTVAPGTSGTLTTTFATATNQREIIGVAPSGTFGANASYTLSVTYPFSQPPHRRAAGH